MITEELSFWLEMLGVILGVGYVIAAAKNKLVAWPLGIVGSVISIFIFVVYAKLYAEAVLYFYYVLAGFYGWYHWKKIEDDPDKMNGITTKSWKFHAITLLFGILLSFLLYQAFQHWLPGGEKPMVDSFTTIFSFIATYFTTKKYLENWIYWVVIDLVSVFLYWSRGLEMYSGLMVLYTVIAAYAYFDWKKRFVHA